MRRKLLGSIDQSTTASKFALFDASLKIVSQNSKNHQQICLQPGWVEHDPEEIIENVVSSMNASLKEVNLEEVEIDSLGVTNQRETVVAWSRETGRPYHNAIVWSDTRTKEISSHFISEKCAQNPNFYKKVNGLVASTYFSAFKINWLIENNATVRANLHDVLFGTIDTWVVYNLTNRETYATDVTNASRTFLMDATTLSWSPKLLKEFGIPLTSLPQIQPSYSDFGRVNHPRLEQFKDIQIRSVLGDQHSAMVGMGLFDSGNTKCTYGTGCFFFVNTGEELSIESTPNLLSTVLYQIEGEKPLYGLEGSIEAGGNVINWTRDALGMFENFEERDKELAKAVDNGGVYFVPSLTGLLAPHWNPNAKGMFYGMTLNTQKGNLLHATLESIIFRVKEIVDELPPENRVSKIYVDGGITQFSELMQKQSDLLELPLHYARHTDSTLAGVVCLIGIAKKWWTKEQITQLTCSKKQIVPLSGNSKLKDDYQKWRKVVDACLHIKL